MLSVMFRQLIHPPQPRPFVIPPLIITKATKDHNKTRAYCAVHTNAMHTMLPKTDRNTAGFDVE